MDTQHKRRVRYQGTHPKSYKEKYKELAPHQYPEMIDKKLKKGNTPVGMHLPICLNEIMDFLQITPSQVGLDATLGYGGHTLAMLKQLNGTGHLYALDVDAIEIKKTGRRLADLGYTDKHLTTLHLNFAQIDTLEPCLFNFALADLGVSSMQLDNPDRGFSYKHEGPLDLRLNPEKGVPAAELLKTMSQPHLQGLLIENADEPHAERISRAIIAQIKKGNAPLTTTHLKNIITDALAFLPLEQRKKACQRTFQALRIDVNRELDVLYEFLEKLPTVMAKGGRIAILTFHSGEDRLVKQSFKHFLGEGVYSSIATDVIRPSKEECNRNARARSAKMRWAIKA